MAAVLQEFIHSHPRAVLFGVLVSDRLPVGLAIDVHGDRLPTPYGLLKQWMKANLRGEWCSSATAEGIHAFAVAEPGDRDTVIAAFGPFAHRRLKLFGRPLPTLNYHDGDYARVGETIGFAVDFQPDDSNLIRTSLHETGHLLVGEALGKRGSLYLWRDRRASAWGGRVRFDDDPYAWAVDDRIVVAFAGLVAEEALCKKSGGMSPVTIFRESNAQRGGGNNLLMSLADLELAGPFNLRHVERCHKLVSANASAIKKRARAARALALSAADACGQPPPDAISSER
jgi:hypothetical protein